MTITDARHYESLQPGYRRHLRERKRERAEQEDFFKALGLLVVRKPEGWTIQMTHLPDGLWQVVYRESDGTGGPGSHGRTLFHAMTNAARAMQDNILRKERKA